jgi:hypothetical protein
MWGNPKRERDLLASKKYISTTKLCFPTRENHLQHPTVPHNFMSRNLCPIRIVVWPYFRTTPQKFFPQYDV